MPLVILTVIVQACFIFHVFKTGRPYWWAYVILGFPVLGCVIYYFVEVFPGSREHYAANRASREIARALDPEKELRRWMEAVEISPTVQNRVALAPYAFLTSSSTFVGEAERPLLRFSDPFIEIPTA